MELLPLDLLEMQINHIDLLLSMYSTESGEISIGPTSLALYTHIKSALDSPSSNARHRLYTTSPPPYASTAPAIELSLAVPVDDDDPRRTVRVIIQLAITSGPDQVVALSAAKHPPFPSLSLSRVTWINRKTLDALSRHLPSGTEDCLNDAIDYLTRTTPHLLATPLLNQPSPSSSLPSSARDDTTDAIERVWFYLPSLSTRQKRQDLTALAPHYAITGFLVAGKPSVLCLEGTAIAVQAYIADIKRNSWSDVPSFQKKISERFRERGQGDSDRSGNGSGNGGGVERKFVGMRELTDEIERHGERGNRGDLAQVEQFLKGVGLGDAFARVFMQREG